MTSDSKWVWIPDAESTFAMAELIREEGAVATVKGPSGSLQELPLSQIDKVNPAQFDRANDIAELTFLNEASVLHNLNARYIHDEIYTYSGLFLVAVNPYKTLPIYDGATIKSFENKKRDEAVPHIYSVADVAYRQLLQTKHDQSILITGESGAGKTENTKRVIQYLSAITSGTNADGIDKKILETNPVLESFGNAQTVRNNNSSRFGKFVRIEFSDTGAICGASIEWYLLEKSRVITQSSSERSYHIFYQLLSGADAALKEKLLIEPSATPKDFAYLSESAHSITGVDDAQEFRHLISSLQTVGMSQDEIHSILVIVATVLHLGNIELKNESADQGRFANAAQVAKVCQLLGVSVELFSKAVLKPKIKAGREEMTQARSSSQARFALNALSKSLYERLFGHLVSLLNIKLKGGAHDAVSFIGVLDIAGFEIFENNSFEQLCINYTNEKLQQFFNHHMFVLEQAEYVNEKIEWEYVDYGVDLQPTIDLIERTNPMGIFSCLDEDSVMPRATDASFTDKLAERWTDKNPKFQVSRLTKGFVVSHYAGDVEYQTEGWLEKNKDPLSEPITELLQMSSNKLVKQLFTAAPPTEASAGRRRNGMFRTVAQRHKEQLTHLMTTLGKTNPHFVRCIIPNKDKKPGKFTNALILDQLRCNGVLEGIRIARSGFPNRLDFAEFRARYQPLAGPPQRFEYVDGQRACSMILKDLNFDTSLYKVGLSKVFFRNGVLAELETRRDELIKEKITALQAAVKGIAVRKTFERRLFRRNAAQAIAKTFKTYGANAGDPWWQMLASMKPLLASATSLEANRRDMRMQKLEDTLQKLRSEQTAFEKDSLAKANVLVGENDHLRTDKARLEEKLDQATKKQRLLAEQLKKGAAMIQALSERPEQAALDAVEQKYRDLDAAHSKLVQAHTELEIDFKRLNSQIAELTSAHTDALAKRDGQTATLEKELSALKGDSRELAALKVELDTAKAAIAAHAGQQQQRDDQHKSDLASRSVAHRDELTKLAAAHETALEAKAKQHSADTDKLVRQNRGEVQLLQDKLAALEKSHAEKLAALAKTHAGKLAEAEAVLEKAHAEKLADLAKAHADKLAAAEAARKRDVAAAAADSAASETATKELARVQAALDASDKSLSTAKARSESLAKDLAAKDEALARVKANAGRAATELLAAHKEIEQLKAAVVASSQEDELRAVNKQLKLDLHLATTELAAYHKARSSESSKLKLDKDRLEREVESLRVGVAKQQHLERDLNRKSARIGLVTDLEQTNADLAEKEGRVRADLQLAQQEIASLRKELSQAAVYKQRLEKVQREKAAALEENSRLMFGAQSQRALPQELELERAKAAEAKKLQSEIKVLKLQLCKSERERKVAEARYPEAQLLAERNHAVRANLDLQDRLKQLEFDKDQLRDQLSMLRPTSTERKSSLKLQRELKYAQTEIDSLKASQRRVSETLSVPKQRPLRPMPSNEQAAPRKLPSPPVGSQVHADLEVYLETELARNKELTESLELYKRRADEYRNKLDGVEVIVRQAQLAEESAKKQLQDQRRRAAEMEGDYEAEVRAAQDALERLRREMAESPGAAGPGMVTRLQEELQTAQSEWKSHQRAADDLRWQVERKDKLVEKLRTTISESDMGTERLREKVDELEANDAAREVAMRRAIREATQSREQALRLEKELENLKTRMELSRTASRASRTSVQSKSGFVFV